MSAQKLRADPDDQPPIEERSIMMPNGNQIRLRIFRTYRRETKTTDELYQIFLPPAALFLYKYYT
jgi:hypothetical protein